MENCGFWGCASTPWFSKHPSKSMQNLHNKQLSSPIQQIEKAPPDILTILHSWRTNATLRGQVDNTETGIERSVWTPARAATLPLHGMACMSVAGTAERQDRSLAARERQWAERTVSGPSDTRNVRTKVCHSTGNSSVWSPNSHHPIDRVMADGVRISTTSLVWSMVSDPPKPP